MYAANHSLDIIRGEAAAAAAAAGATTNRNDAAELEADEMRFPVSQARRHRSRAQRNANSDAMSAVLI
jgi:hypothetical protein